MLISVVMTVYNGEQYLQEAIDSILQQTYRDFEFIIVNDGSTDQTMHILKSIQDPRVRIIDLPKNGGAATALNIGIQYSQGEWIAIQDADDISLSTRLEEQVYYVQKHPDISAVGTLKKCISGKYDISKNRLRTEELGNFLVATEHMKSYRFYINPLCHGSVLFSKNVYEKVGGYDSSYKVCYDYELWMKMFEVSPIHKINKVLYHYRIHPESISNKKNPYNEDWVVASTHIKKSVEESNHCEPIFLVLGNLDACNEFKQICKISNLTVYDYVHSREPDTIEKVHRLYQENAIHGVILLEGIQYISIFQALEAKGMEMNKNLFKIWAGYWK